VTTMRYFTDFIPKITGSIFGFSAKNSNLNISETRFLALDFEMTGLDPESDHIVSVGWIPIRNFNIELEGAFYTTINSPKSVGDSAAIHGLHDHDIRNGLALCEVVAVLSDMYHDYTIVMHHAELDLKFLQRAFSVCGVNNRYISYADTLIIEKRRLLRTGQPLGWDSLTLPACLSRHGLPGSKQHNAFNDAFSCAQLFLCQLEKYQSEYVRN
jgi:DNA polymerase III subunit epsilon